MRNIGFAIRPGIQQEVGPSLSLEDGMSINDLHLVSKKIIAAFGG